MARGDRKKAEQKPRRDIYQEVTSRILELLETGVAPWRQPIKRSDTSDGMPKSLSTGKNYRGINVFLLSMTSWAHGYGSDYWATFNQVTKNNGCDRQPKSAAPGGPLVAPELCSAQLCRVSR